MSKKRKTQIEQLRKWQRDLDNRIMCHRCEIEYNKYNLCPICGYTI